MIKKPMTISFQKYDSTCKEIDQQSENKWGEWNTVKRASTDKRFTDDGKLERNKC